MLLSGKGGRERAGMGTLAGLVIIVVSDCSFLYCLFQLLFSFLLVVEVPSVSLRSRPKKK